jgi:acyl-CoA dehydrogenase
MIMRAKSRTAFGKTLDEHGVNRHWIAESRIDIDQARLLTLYAADKMDKVGNKEARAEIAMIKVVAPNVALRVIDRSIQIHGAGGISQDFHLAGAWAGQRTLRFADGPDEVHRETITKIELKKYDNKAHK